MGQLEKQNGLISWFAHNHVAANLMMLIIIVAGIFSVITMSKRANPEIDVNFIQVSMVYPGAAPADVENGILLQIESAMGNVDGIDIIRSTANEGSGTVLLEIDDSYDMNEVLNEVKNNVDSIQTFPVQAEPARVSRSIFRNDAIRLAIYGDMDPVTHKELAQSIRNEVLDLDDVNSVGFSGIRNYEITIEVSEDTLLKYGLTLDDIAQRISFSSLDLPAGSLETAGGEILVRTNAQAYDYQDFSQIVLLTTSDGSILTVGDIASVIDGFEDSENYSRFDGKPAIELTIQISEDQNVLQVTESVRNFIEERRASLPAGINLDVWADTSFYLEDRLNMMTENMLIGAFLVFLLLAFFLEIKLAFWVIVGIPVCFLGAFAFMPTLGIDINLMSLFGFIMVLGIVVDDAIIIGESAHHSITKYGHSTDSVVHGALRVAKPATFGVLTTIVAFLPLMMITGIIAPFTEAIGGVVILCLIFSLVESKLILPSHLVHFGKPNKKGIFDKLQTRCNEGLHWFVTRYYQPFLRTCIKNRYSTLASFIGMLILAGGLVGGGFIRVVFLPEIPSDFFQVNVTMVEGSPEQQSRDVMDKLEAAALALNGNIEFIDSETETISTKVVDHLLIVGTGAGSGLAFMEFDKDVASQVSPEQISEFMLDYIGNMPGLKTIDIQTSDTIGGDAISYQLVSANPEQLTAAALELESHLYTYTGLVNITNGAVSSKDELRLEIKPQAEVMGLTLNDISSQVRSAFYGAQAQRIQRGDDELRVMVRYPEENRIGISDLENMYIRSNQGDVIPFSSVADYNMDQGYATISRIDGERSVAVTADIIASLVEPAQVVQDLEDNFFPQLFQRYPSLSLTTDGGISATEDLMTDMIRGLLFALFGIYALLAIPLRSYMQPIIIMSVIPFGVVGAIIGHMIIDMPLNFLSMLGIIALSGVVVNDSIILLDFINNAKSKMALYDAVIQAGSARFRAILLTSLTTFTGLLPIIMETSLQARYLIPMAASLAFGILFATVITLLLTPCLYVILEDFNKLVFRKKAVVNPAIQAS
ncbi:MAG: efflux RND transporter permease subunit [Gammaproteobacteria bacterium]|nr:efflux RND transporter permease subunit [Gammaproteobacteria bacterium]